MNKLSLIILSVCCCFHTLSAQTLYPYLVKDINPGEPSSHPRAFNTFKGEVYFSADDGKHGIQLWKSDGTGDGTTMVKEIIGTSSIYALEVLNNELVFVSSQNSKGTLWKTDGTEGGTVMIKDLDPKDFTNSISPGFVINNNLYFMATTSELGTELWKSDGTEKGTVVVKDIAPGPKTSILPQTTVLVNNMLFFIAQNTSNQKFELWKSDGTPNGTVIVKDLGLKGDFPYSPGNLANADGTLYFSAHYNGNSYLWKSDGTESGTVPVKKVFIRQEAMFTAVNQTVFFKASDETSEPKVWKSDGTEAGTVAVENKDVPSSSPTTPILLTRVDNELFFTAKDESGIIRLWKTDGNQVAIIKDLHPSTFSVTTEFYVANNTLYFTAIDPVSFKKRLWKSDGTASGTVSINIKAIGITRLYLSNSSIFFTAVQVEGSASTGYELWALSTATGISDNEVANSGLKLDISPNPMSGTTKVSFDGNIDEGTQFVLFDIFGVEVRRFTATTSTFIIEQGNLSNGTYILRWTNGVESCSKRIVMMR